MVGTLQPLASNFKIVNDDGTPTLYFTRWAQQRQIDISGGITADQAQQLIDDWAVSREVIAGSGLDGGGDLSVDVTLSLGNTTVVPGTYGDATHVPEISVDAQGRIIAVNLIPVSGGGGASPPTIKSSTVSAFNANTFNNPLPASAIAGDYAIICTNHGWNCRAPTGALTLDLQSGPNTNGGVFVKYLDATDISRGYVTTTYSGTYNGCASMTVLDGTTVSGIMIGRAARTTGSASPTNLATFGDVSTHTTAIMYGGTRGNGDVSMAVAAIDDSIVGAQDSASVGQYVPGAAGVITETFTFVDDSGGHYVAIVLAIG